MTTGKQAIPIRALVQALILVMITSFLPLLISQRWVWREAWVYGAIGVVGFGISRLLAVRRHPDLLAERLAFTRHRDIKAWDKTLLPLLALGGLSVPLVAGLDTRLGSSPQFSGVAKGLSFAVLLVGYLLPSYALIVNPFFSSVVRIQQDRGHHVVSNGPYRWIRHPGYAGALLANTATPFFLDSRWAFAPALSLAAVFVVRTGLEDNTLQRELRTTRTTPGGCAIVLCQASSRSRVHMLPATAAPPRPVRARADRPTPSLNPLLSLPVDLRAGAAKEFGQPM